MNKTTLAILWHMHQPYYRDILTGESTMPWVRLHGIHSYYDMLTLYERFPNVKGTINFVPSLVDQLLQYTEQEKTDSFLEHTMLPADSLSPQQKAFLLQYFFMANPTHKIAPYPAYYKLFTRRGLDPSRIDYQQAIRFFSNQDYLDIQVYFNLVWFGFAAREEHPEIIRMLASNEHFTEENKKFTIDTQKQILKNLLEKLRRAATSQNVEICTTPFYHPIFPLLLDTNFTQRCQPKAILPPQLKLPGMASHQLNHALESMERWIGVRPQGMWPAEGSVCPEMIPLLFDAGLKWMATDDRILLNSLPKDKKEKEVSIHEPFTAKFGDKEIQMVFRDHGLADLIGFTYSNQPTAKAIADFVDNIKKIDAAATSERLVTVILDGENAWEFYPNSGRDFLHGLFEALEREKLPTARIGEYLVNHKPKKTITNLYTGSWIDANFYIWIGKPQKNKAWTYIKQTFDRIGDMVSPEKRAQDQAAAKAFECLAAACGSDWFWWYDDDFDSAFKPDFDKLFRLHLKNSFIALNKDVPPFLFEPIYHFSDTKGSKAKPPGFMYPVIDGMRSSFFEWSNAVRFNVSSRGGAMAFGTELFESISFGFNPDAVFLRLNPYDADAGFSLPNGEDIVFYLHDGDKNHKFIIGNAGDTYKTEMVTANGELLTEDLPFKWAAVKVLEVEISFAKLGYKPGEKMTIAIAIHRRGIEARRYSHINFEIPDDTYEQHMWAV